MHSDPISRFGSAAGLFDHRPLRDLRVPRLDHGEHELVLRDDAERERIRHKMGEPYRTLLGHFRHEVGHHFWSRLVEIDDHDLEAFRKVFGDERIDYQESMNAHYGDGGKVWTDDFVSQYATMHPWEDFAETFAHYLHMVDALATARGFDLTPSSPYGNRTEFDVSLDFDPYLADAKTLAEAMGPMSFTLNAMNRSMGLPDLYPFRLSEAIVAKLDFVQRVLAKARAEAPEVENKAEPAA